MLSASGKNVVHCFPRYGTLSSKRLIHQTRSILNKKEEFRVDEADLFAPRLNGSDYKSVRESKLNYDWNQGRSEEEMKKESHERMERMAKLTAMFQGIMIVVGIGAVGTTYMNWPAIESWWVRKGKRLLGYSSSEGHVNKKIFKKKTPIVPIVPETQLGPTVPGVYYWGHQVNSSGKETDVAFPLRVTHLDNMQFRDIYLGNDGNNLAIDSRGDLLSWNCDRKHLLLADQNLVKLKVSNNTAYGLNRSGEILVIPIKNDQALESHKSLKRSFFLPWKKYTTYNWKLDVKHSFQDRGEKYVTDFDAGKEHLVLLSNKGKAYSCSTGLKLLNNSKSRGQFGIPAFSQFDTLPEPHKLYEIELLNKGIDKLDNLIVRKIEQVCCGNYHTAARDSKGNVFTFGSNTYGQLGYPISYNSEIVSFPKQVGKLQPYFSRDEYYRATNIEATAEATFLTVGSQTMEKHFQNNSEFVKTKYFAFGNGINGTLGSGNFKNSQSGPIPLKVLNDTQDKVANWSCGEEHILCKLENGYVVGWGLNSSYQLANGKKIKTARPENSLDLLKPGEKISYEDLRNTKLCLNEKQQIATGGNSCCIYWRI
ncbi:hypothetical protein Kpol_1023p8 [Vanderwaltozyma polyspora DSM 70294]|uniref:Protein FMP25, mitochondrial n=1 Tax=Vanderwaltozyma polyspora (strain ATCC 22028 / DSM 70294 / BCRC 21397 / CBS 2163 / NBRC 10782 / NRRL Y-8283 / UCD 57-17) TaxID=436907 RepID=A7TFN1_VANPO|nr:uncharacterized protein Kpol_1023p8 [Vanderwaltozyma polyspora DSM 70294]EDO18839.1 hypothetical protein Kpol_1023p8 [Vanderwaltozyma polyspora DSM 70294]